MSDETISNEIEKKIVSKATLCQNQIQKCLELRSKEMREGYTDWVEDEKGNLKPKFIPDARLEYISAVNALRLLLTPELCMGESKFIEEYDWNKGELFELYCYKEICKKKERFEGGVTKIYYTGRRWMPRKGEVLKIITDNGEKKSFEIDKGGWDSQVDKYLDEMVSLTDELFSELNKVVHELRYFDKRRSVE